MTIRRFCDCCGVELTANRVTNRVTREYSVTGKPKVQVEVTAGVNGTWNGGELCTDCVVLAVDKGKDFQR